MPPKRKLEEAQEQSKITPIPRKLLHKFEVDALERVIGPEQTTIVQSGFEKLYDVFIEQRMPDLDARSLISYLAHLFTVLKDAETRRMVSGILIPVPAQAPISQTEILDYVMEKKKVKPQSTENQLPSTEVVIQKAVKPHSTGEKGASLEIRLSKVLRNMAGIDRNTLVDLKIDGKGRIIVERVSPADVSVEKENRELKKPRRS